MFTIDDAEALVGDARRLGKRVVFTQGVFDLLHPGHLRHLSAARARGDMLVVGVTSDRLVRALKGLGRPVTPERERAEILSALAVVDAVAIVDSEAPQAVVDRLQPDVFVQRAPVDQRWSTSAIIERAKDLPGG